MRLVNLREIKLKEGFTNLRNDGLIIFNLNEMNQFKAAEEGAVSSTHSDVQRIVTAFWHLDFT
jgi:hypothetical protein